MTDAAAERKRATMRAIRAKRRAERAAKPKPARAPGPPADTRPPVRASEAADALAAGADAAERVLASRRGIRWPADLRAQALRDAVHQLSDDARRLLLARLVVEEGQRLSHERGASFNAQQPPSPDGRVWRQGVKPPKKIRPLAELVIAAVDLSEADQRALVRVAKCMATRNPDGTYPLMDPVAELDLALHAEELREPHFARGKTAREIFEMAYPAEMGGQGR
jgi:hypothetical protein